MASFLAEIHALYGTDPGARRVLSQAQDGSGGAMAVNAATGIRRVEAHAASLATRRRGHHGRDVLVGQFDLAGAGRRLRVVRYIDSRISAVGRAL